MWGLIEEQVKSFVLRLCSLCRPSLRPSQEEDSEKPGQSVIKERLLLPPSIPSQDLSELCHLDISYNHLRLVPKMGPSGAALGTLILRGNELQSLHGEWGSMLGQGSSPAWKGMGAV